MNASKQVQGIGLEHIPPGLRGLPIWGLWRYEEHQGRLAKVHYCPDGVQAQVDRPEDCRPLALGEGGVDVLEG